MSDHRDAQQEHENAYGYSKFISVWSQCVWPIINHSGYKGLNYTKLTINSKNLKNNCAIIKQKGQNI